jgi:RHS repeat-associated protein
MIFKHSIKSILFSLCLTASVEACAQSEWNTAFTIATASGNSVYSYQKVPAPLTILINPTYQTNNNLQYQWYESSLPLSGFVAIGGATGSTYSFSSALSQTSYFYCIVTDPSLSSGSNTVTSNTFEILVGSINWENINYVREHEVLTPGLNSLTSTVANFETVDQLPVTQNVQLNGDGLPAAQKLQTTTYMDGLGRSIEKISAESATPAAGGSLWGDLVQFSEFDMYGRQPLQYLAYTTTTSQPGKYKTNPVSDESNYYSTTYQQSSAFTNIQFDNSPLNRPETVNQSGTAWAAGQGESTAYNFNTVSDSVQIFTVDYAQGDAPVYVGLYAPNTLYKTVHTDESGNEVIEFKDLEGRLILTKVQVPLEPGVTANSLYAAWACTYSVYDDFGLLRFRIQPNAVTFLDQNAWSFSATGGLEMLAGMCFQYNYDDKGRCIWKKAPGAGPLNMMYDARDRLVFMQDGNQATLNPPYGQWTANLYDDFDRLVLTTLYNPAENQTQLKSDINNAATTAQITVTNNAVNPVADLVVNTRNTSISQYTATNNITFVANGSGSFTSFPGDNYTARILTGSSALPQSYTESVTTYTNPISNASLSNASVCTILKYEFYDDYTYTGAKPFATDFTNNNAYGTGDLNVIPIATSQRTLSLPTGSIVRILGTATFLLSTEYYDEKGRHIQTIEDNVLQGYDVTTYQYHFDGRLLSTDIKHTTINTGYSDYHILTKNDFDLIGRIRGIEKMFGPNPFKTLSTYNYDDMGRLGAKNLDPGYVSPLTGNVQLESLAYSYNIHNQITGINKDYALKTPGIYSKWGHFFGLYLGYDNEDHAFNTSLLDGHVTGQMWCTQGDDAQRKYDYTYDNAGRLTNAAYNEMAQSGGTWSKSTMDFSSAMSYDFNGNLQTMSQMGVALGNSSPFKIDDLAYQYMPYGNQLSSVTDNMPQSNINGQFGDFKDGTNAAGTSDYVYDANGNVVVDLNKNISNLSPPANTNGISFNFLDKPDHININGAGTIQIIYDAEGDKLQKIFTPVSGTAITTSYINEFVYQSQGTGNPSLQYINFEEGRLRLMTPVGTNDGYDWLSINGNIPMPNNMEGTYDYFIRDYQQNVRMILTEETDNGMNECTLETSRAGVEDPIFGQTGAGNEVEATRFAIAEIPGQNSGGGWQNAAIGQSVSKLGNLAPGGEIGPNTLLKVMAGDLISATTLYYYQPSTGSTQGASTSLTQNVITALVGALSSNGSIIHPLTEGNLPAIGNQLTNTPAIGTITEPGGDNPTASNPQAYLTVLFFDERFNFVQEGSISMPVEANAANSSNLNLALTNIQAPKNGYVYVYVSNASDIPVYFDNFQVALNHGPIIEEDHYYSFGLKIAGISSVKISNITEGDIDNKNLYNDKELFDDGGLDWYDYGFRNYDPQIGRFPQLDPLTDDFPYLTPYQYASDEPIANVDMDGLEAWLATGTTVADYWKDGAQETLATVVVSTAHAAAKSGGFFQQLSSFISKEIAPRLAGALKTLGGGAIMAVGAATSEIGIGVPLIAFGADIAASGAQQIVDGKEHQTLTEKILAENAGMKPEDASNLVDLSTVYFSAGIDPEVETSVGNGVTKVNDEGLPVEFDTRTPKNVSKKGVYDVNTSEGKYVGQTGQGYLKRLAQHFGKGGKLSFTQFEDGIFHDMDGSTKPEREVYEQYLITKYGGPKGNILLNQRNPMGGRMDTYNKMIKNVIKKYNLPQ